MRQRVIWSVVFMLFAGSAMGIQPIPEESGFSGFVNVGAGVLRVKSNMVTGNDIADFGQERIDSIFDKPDSETDAIPVINGELSYTFASTRTQIYVGNLLEDWVRFEFGNALGVRQELADKSIVELSYLFTGIPTEVWEDPYIAGEDRDTTDREAQGVRIAYDKILGSGLEVSYAYRDIELDDERSGEWLGLTPDERRLLSRDGSHHRAEALYLFKLAENQFVAPAIRYSQYDLDGAAMSNDRLGFYLTHTYMWERMTLVSNIGYTKMDYDERNPIYDRRRDGDQYGGTVTGFYHRLFGVQNLSGVASAVCYKEDSDISFYDSEVLGGTFSVMYRF